MKKTFVLLSCICLLVATLTAVQAFAKYPDAVYADVSVKESSASSALTNVEDTDTEEAEIYPDRVIYASGTIQMLVSGCWYIESDDPNLKIWVWNWSSSTTNNKGNWRSVAKGEIVSQENSIVKIEIDKEKAYQVEIYYLVVSEDESPDCLDCKIKMEDLNFFAKGKNINFSHLKGKDYSFELISGSDNAVISLNAMAEYVSMDLLMESRKLYGFIIGDDRGFLTEVLEYDREKIKKDPAYKKNIIKRLNEVVIRNDQFVIAICK